MRSLCWSGLSSAAVLVGLNLAVGCAHGSHTTLVANPPPSRPAGCSLEIFSSSEEVGRRFKRVCLISGESGAMATMDEAMGAIRKNACKCGAEAVVLNQVESRGNRFSGIKINLTGYGIVFEKTGTAETKP